MSSPVTTLEPAIAVDWEAVLDEAQTQASPPLCYVCGLPAIHECERCDRHVCRAHHRVYLGFCQVERDYCDGCFASKTLDERRRWQRDARSAPESAYERWLREMRPVPESAYERRQSEIGLLIKRLASV